MSENLLALAERLEKAEGPDRELDAEIAVAVDAQGHAGEKSVREIIAGSPLNTIADVAKFWPRLERYTASIDAAMTLVPEGWTVANLCQSDRKGWWCELRRGHLTSYDKTAFSNQLENQSAALAVCAAALRARSAS